MMGSFSQKGIVIIMKILFKLITYSFKFRKPIIISILTLLIYNFLIIVNPLIIRNILFISIENNVEDKNILDILILVIPLYILLDSFRGLFFIL